MLKQSPSSKSSLIIVGDYLLDPSVGLLSGPSGVHHICDRMTALLCLLVEKAGATVDRDGLIAELGKNGQATPQVLNQCVARLRHYFEDNARSANYIETVPNHGYRLVAPVFGTTQEADAIRVARCAHRPEGRSRIGVLIREFRDRKVCRSILIYAIVVWFMFQLSEIIVPALALPSWVNSLVVLLGLLGFPIAASLAWIFDWTPNGLIRQPVSSPAAGVRPARRTTDLILDTLLLAAAAVLGATLIVSSVGFGLLSEASAGSIHEASSAVVETVESSDAEEGRIASGWIR